MDTMTIATASKLLAEGSLSSQELVSQCLDSIEKQNEALNALVSISPTALAEAEALDREAVQQGRRSPLHGIPFIIKENIDVCGLPSTVSSALFKDSAPKTLDSTIAAHLRNAGAVLLGKSNMDELAAHVSGMTSVFGPTVNPFSPEGDGYSPGGSSSGSAASVAAGFSLAAVGTDTGGSVRIPAAWCGLCGLRPTHGLMSSFGVFPRAETLDAVGFFALNVQDMETLFSTLTKSVSSAEVPPSPLREFSVTVPENIFDVSLDQETTDLFNEAVENCKACGMAVTFRRIPWDFALYEKLSNTIRAYEFALHAGQWIFAFPQKELLHPLIVADYERGLSIARAEYLEALAQRKKLQSSLDELFGDSDMLLAPATPCRPLPLSSPLAAFKAARQFMDLGSVTGIPTLVVQNGKTSEGLPSGIQLIGKPWQETLLIQAGLTIEHFRLS